MTGAATLRTLLCGLASLAITASATAEPFIGQFELKDLESEPGFYEFQSQNAWSWGQPSRQVEMDGGDFEADDNAVIQQRYAQELEMGISDRLKMRVGIEFEKERVDDPETLANLDDFESLQLQEFGTELIAVLVPREGDGAGLGVVAEIELPLIDGESAGFLIGPILEFQAGPWFAAAVPAFVRSIGGGPGEPEDHKWDFSYASQLSYRFSDTWMLSIEGYGTIDRIGNTGSRPESAETFGDFNQHRIGPILYFDHPLGHAGTGGGPADEDKTDTTELSVGLGVLAGLNDNTPDYTVKLSIEIEF